MLSSGECVWNAQISPNLFSRLILSDGACMYNRGVLKQQAGSPDWGPAVADILRAGIQRPKKGHDAGDHPPITPMKAASEAELGHEAWRLYDYITRHFIATVSNDVFLSSLCSTFH